MRIFCTVRQEWKRANKRCIWIGIIALLVCGLFSVAMTALLGGRGALYYYLRKPSMALPRIFFILIWIGMYALLGGGMGHIFSCKGRISEKERARGFMFFCMMCVLNVFWCPLFFAARAYFMCFLSVLCMIGLTVCCFCCLRRASLLFNCSTVGYLAWLLYCLYLNFFIFLYNG